MKIALIMKCYSLRRGGGEYDLVRLSASLADRGHDVHLFVNRVEGEADPRLRLHPVPMLSFWGPLKILSFARNAPRAVRQSGIEFDVIHAMTQAYPSDLYWNGGGLQINWIPARYGAGSLNTAWLNPRHAANLFVEKQIFKPGNYRYAVALTGMEKEQILRHYRVPEKRLAVIPNGIDPQRFNLAARETHRDAMRRALGLGDNDMLLLTVGSDGRRKGFPQLFQALAGIKQNWKGALLIAGNDPPSRWRPEIERLGLGQQVLFHGHEAMVEKLYAAADLLVLASIFEGYGNVIPEAMACGCPALTTRSVGAADLICPGADGWVINSCRDISAFTKALEEAIFSPERIGMGRRAADKMAGFTWDWTVDELEKVYQKIADEKKAEKDSSPR